MSKSDVNVGTTEITSLDNSSTKNESSSETHKVKKCFGSILKIKIHVIKEKFIELARNFNCECFPKIFKNGSHIVNRLIWTFLFGLFSVLTLFLLIQNILDYFR